MPPPPLSNVTFVWSDELRRTEPLVSVCIVTYNQKEYIEDALDSVLKQEVNFDYELIVGDDYSTDGTRDILREYQQAHPDRIRLNLHDEHYDGIPGRKNMVANLESARGRYVAILDGDDYWISTDKLQRQTAFLEDHPEVSFSFHDALVGSDVEKGSAVPDFEDYLMSERYAACMAQSRIFDLDDLIERRSGGNSFSLRGGNRFSIPASSVMYRRSLLPTVPEWFWHMWNADWALQMYFGRHGPAYYHCDLRSCWRKSADSVSVQFKGDMAWVRRQHEQAAVLREVVPEFDCHSHRDRYFGYVHRHQMHIEWEHGRVLRTAQCFVKAAFRYAMSYVRRATHLLELRTSHRSASSPSGRAGRPETSP